MPELPRQSNRADDDPRVGDVIKRRSVQRNERNVARKIIAIDRIGERVLTVGVSGRQRDRWMGFRRLGVYDLVSRRDG